MKGKRQSLPGEKKMKKCPHGQIYECTWCLADKSLLLDD
jgi:hypothetical protein